MKSLSLLLFTLLILLSGCMPQSGKAAPPTTETLAPPDPADITADCPEAAFTAPVMPAEVPGYLQVDPATGLHMTGNVQEIDLQEYRLKISGLVDQPLELRYEELRCMPKVEDDPLLVCEGYFQDKASWAGVPIAYLLGLAGVQPEAAEIVMVSADGYQLSLPIKDAMREPNFLAYELDGEILPVLHGFPLRAVFPGKNGFNWVKWLVEIQVR